MLRTGRALALTILFAVLLTCGIRGDEKSDKDKKPDPPLDLTTLRLENAALYAKISEKMSEDFKKLNKEQQDRQVALDKILTKNANDLDAMQKEIAALNAKLNSQGTQIESLQNQVKSISDKVNPQPRVARSIDPAPLTPPTGQIRLVNQLANPITVTIENTAYLLRGGETRMLNNRPAGALNYQVSAPFDYTGVYSRSTQLDPNQQLSILVGP